MDRAPKNEKTEVILPQLKTGIWIDALIRRAEAGGAFATLARRGDADAGTVLVLVRSEKGLTLYVPERNMEGERVWRSQRVESDQLSERIERRLDFDPDINLVEIDDRLGRHFIEEVVLSDQSDPAEPADALAAAKALFRDR